MALYLSPYFYYDSCTLLYSYRRGQSTPCWSGWSGWTWGHQTPSFYLVTKWWHFSPCLYKNETFSSSHLPDTGKWLYSVIFRGANLNYIMYCSRFWIEIKCLLEVRALLYRDGTKQWWPASCAMFPSLVTDEATTLLDKTSRIVTIPKNLFKNVHNYIDTI